jgi:5-methylcytosine-specific restriction endonuclease McrA
MLTLVPSTKKCSGRCERDLPLDSFGVHTRGLYGRKSECKKCLTDKEAARRGADPEAARAYKREWWANREWTPEERAGAAAKSQAWYADPKNKARHKVRVRAYHVDHADVIRARAIAWAKANPERVRANYRRWAVENADVLRGYGERRAALYGASSFTFEDWSEILELHDHRCAYCFCNDRPLTMDHVIAISRGGEHSAENIVPACRPCNSKKKDRPVFLMVA